MYRRIMVALDGSAAAERTLSHAEVLAESFGALLVLVRVTPSPTGGAGPPLGIDTERREADRYLTGLHDRLRAQGLPVHFQRAEGEPAGILVDYAREQNADLLILGTHGRAGSDHSTLGSVAAAISRCAPCPVLLVQV